MKDFEEVATNITEHRVIIAVCTLILLILLLIHLFYRNPIHDQTKSTTNELSQDDQFKLKFNFLEILPKIVFSMFLLVLILTLGLLVFIKNMGVHYVVLKKDLNITEAQALKNRLNQSDVFLVRGLQTKIIPIQNKYEVILDHGYVTADKAEDVKIKIVNLSLGLNPYVVGPQKVAGFRKKFNYLKHQYF